jgi:hypothetical protein
MSGSVILNHDIRSLCFVLCIHLLKPSSIFTYDQVYDEKILRGAHIAFMCFVRISEQTATFAL